MLEFFKVIEEIKKIKSLFNHNKRNVREFLILLLQIYQIHYIKMFIMSVDQYFNLPQYAIGIIIKFIFKISLHNDIYYINLYTHKHENI